MRGDKSLMGGDTTNLKKKMFFWHRLVFVYHFLANIASDVRIIVVYREKGKKIRNFRCIAPKNLYILEKKV